MHINVAHQRVPSELGRARFFHACILLSAVICSTLAATVIGPVLPAMQAHFAGVPNIDTLVPVVVTMPMLVLGALAILIGWFADRVGRKRVLVVALLLYAVAGTAPLYLDSIYAILVSRAVVGFAEAAVMTCSTAMIGDYFSGSQRDRYVSLQTTFASISAFIFNLLGGVLGEHGWRTPFSVYALPLLLAPLVAIFLWEPGRQAPSPVEQQDRANEPKFNPWLLALVCAVAVGAGIVFLMVPIQLSFMLVSLGTHSPNAIGIAYAINSVGVILGTLSFGWILVTRFTVLNQLLISTMLCGVGFMVLGNASDYATLTLGGAINGYGCGLMLPASVSWALRTLPFERRGFGMGAFMAAQSIGFFCNPLIVMPMIAHWNSRFTVIDGWGIAMVGLAFIIGTGRLSTRRLRLS